MVSSVKIVYRSMHIITPEDSFHLFFKIPIHLCKVSCERHSLVLFRIKLHIYELVLVF